MAHSEWEDRRRSSRGVDGCCCCCGRDGERRGWSAATGEQFFFLIGGGGGSVRRSRSSVEEREKLSKMNDDEEIECGRKLRCLPLCPFLFGSRRSFLPRIRERGIVRSIARDSAGRRIKGKEDTHLPMRTAPPALTPHLLLRAAASNAAFGKHTTCGFEY